MGAYDQDNQEEHASLKRRRNSPTRMCEVEKIVNDRLLTQQCNDTRDLSALAPNTLLLSYRNKTVQQTLYR